MEKKPVSIERYSQVLDEHKDKGYEMVINAWEMPLLHGLITLVAEHPGVQQATGPTKEFIAQIRWWCREKFAEWGFTPEEVEYLDTRREDAQKKAGVFTVTANAVEIGALTRLLVKEPESARGPLSAVYKQLVGIVKRTEEAAGVTKKILPAGMLEVTDAAGNKITRQPFAWEIEGN